MSNTLALIHTSPVLVPSFSSLCAVPARVARVPHGRREPDQEHDRRRLAAEDDLRRLVGHIDSAAQAGAGVVLVTCSSIGEGVRVARELFDFPVLRIDEPMAERAVDAGRRIGVLATLQTTLAPTVRLLRRPPPRKAVVARSSPASARGPSTRCSPAMSRRTIGWSGRGCAS